MDEKPVLEIHPEDRDRLKMAVKPFLYELMVQRIRGTQIFEHRDIAGGQPFMVTIIIERLGLDGRPERNPQ